jgi:ABC-type antimicrobial peptide transport system permease subunit
MNFAVLFGLTIGAGLLGSLPTFAAATADKALETKISNAHPSVRNIEIESPPANLNSALAAYINESLDSLAKKRVIVGNVRLDANPSAPIIIDNQEIEADLANIWVWSFDKLTQHAVLVSGEWPEVTYPQTQIEALKPPTIQTAITEDVAKESGIQIGDQLQDVNEFKYLITGIVQISDPEDDIWWQDNKPFHIIREPGLNEDTNIVPIFIHSQSMKEYLPGHSSKWRYVLDSSEINVNNAESIEADLTNLKYRLSAVHASMTSGLPNLIEEYRQNLSTSRLVMYLLSSQAFLFVIFTLILMASMLVNSSHLELAIMTSRGASRIQIILTFGIQILILALIAGFLLGPLLAKLGMAIWGLVSGDKIPSTLPSETWRMSILAAGICWVAVILTIIPATRSSLLQWQQSVARPPQSTFWQRSFFDIFLLIIGMLLFWQLSNSGSFIMRRFQGTSFADPLLLIGPSLLLIALAMLYLRLFPVILSSLSRLVKSGRGIVLPLGLTKIARKPQNMSWVILLISMAAGLILFANIYSEALYETQIQIARYQAGSDIRLDINKIPDTHLAAIAEQLPTSRVLRGRVQEGSGRGVTILAVEPETFKQVSEYPLGMTNLTIEIIMQAIREPTNDEIDDLSTAGANPYTEQRGATEAIPAIFSYSAIPKNGVIGDQRELLMAGQPISFEVKGIIADFPTLTSEFLIVNTKTFEKIVGSSITTQLKNSEAWIKTTGYDHDQIVSFPAFILATISLAGLILANYFTIQKRSHEFSILRAFGLSRGQSNQLLIGEGILVLALGLFSGLILGISLTRLMHPYISLAVTRNLPGMTVHQINISWESVAFLTALMTFSYGLAAALIIFALWKSDVQQELRTGDE